MMIFTAALREAKFETAAISDSQVALARLAEIVPEVVILDLHLPNISGIEILQQMHADERLAKTRIMIGTADVKMAQDIHKDVDIVLIKPISFDQLRDLATRLRPPVSIN